MRRAFLLAGIFLTITLVFGLHRYLTFYASYDQGIFNQVFWNSLHGNFFQSSLSSVLSGAVVQENQVPAVFYHRLGQHFTPALLLWLPFYALFPSAATLVVLQVTLMTAGGLLLYGLARQYLQPALALMITTAYYAANAVIGPTFSNFHDLCQIPVFVFGLLLAFEKRRWWLFWLLATLTLAVREDTGVILFGIGAYLIGSRRSPKTGLALCVLSFGYILFVTNVLMPSFSEDISSRFMIERFGQYAQGDQASTTDIIWAIISNPVRLLNELFIRALDQKVLYLLVQALPLAFVPLMSPSAFVIAGFPLLQLFLQQGETPLSIHIRYAVTVVPGFFYSAILWWSGNQKLLTQRVWRFWMGAIVLSLLIAFIYSPHRVFYFILPDSYRPLVYIPLTRQWQHSGHLRAVINQLPPDASVAATTYVVPHISGRRGALRLPFVQVRNDQNQVVDVDYILADLWQLQQYQVAFRAERLNVRQFMPLFEQLLDQGKYGIQDLQDGVLLMRKGSSSQPIALARWRQWQEQLPILPPP